MRKQSPGCLIRQFLRYRTGTGFRAKVGWPSGTPAFKPTDWTEPPQWLPLQTGDLGNSLNDFLLSNTIPPLLIANMPLPSSPVPAITES
jgi:hypothetical protein